MDERFLHYIWKFQKFSSRSLQLSDGRSLKIFHQGNHNHNSGPDFEEAQIQIEGLKWAGSIEIHIKSSDWYAHKHDSDKAYKNTILHVVWKNNSEVIIDKETIPTLVLSNFVDPDTIRDYENFLQSDGKIPCESQIDQIHDLHFINTLDRMLIERMQLKSENILKYLNRVNGDWDEVSYLSLAENFGFSVNKTAFIELANSLPFSDLRKNQENLFKLESLVFGQAGFLDQPENSEYGKALQEEYEYLRKKYQLNKRLKRINWKHSKLRPANFPARRLAQFAAICTTKHFFTSLLSIKNRNDFIRTFNTETSVYWLSHHDLGKLSKNKNQQIGDTTIDILIINWVAPTLAAYGKYMGDQQYMDQSVQLLEQTKAENNRITRIWKQLGKESRNAFDSQAMIGLFKNYCSLKKCLLCPIGQEIMNK